MVAMAAVVLTAAIVLMTLRKLRETMQLKVRMVTLALLMVRTVALALLMVVVAAIVLMAAVVLLMLLNL